MKWVAVVLALSGAATAAACYDAPSRPEEPTATALTPVTSIPGHEGLAVDTSAKQGPRALAAEAYLRSYQMLFGGISPEDIAAAARGTDGNAEFETWSRALGALGLPDYAGDLDRSADTNTMMLASYERLGVVLCDRAVEHDLRGGSPRRVFDFAASSDPGDRAAFDAGFDRLHRTFLGYPARLATGRGDRFFALYKDVAQRHAAPGAAASLFSPVEAAWAAVCYGLVRHPEFHLY